ncbi:MAG: CpsB/CapC family capsule biosynthesis tyrosine phosphatase [Bacillota bacterium]
MIDFYTHLLPGLDDGAESMAEALAMARLAYADGTRSLVLTPHHFPGRS